MISRKVEKAYHQMSIVELITILETRSDTEIVNQAKAEIKKRDLTDEEISIARAEYKKVKEYRYRRKEEPLDLREKLIFFFLPIISFRFDYINEEIGRYRQHGFKNKMHQMIIIQIWGLLFYILVFGLIVILIRK